MAHISLRVLFSTLDIVGIYIIKTCRTGGVAQPKIVQVVVRYTKC